jgi:23S rRNA pseudouridine2605 synthase
MTRSSAKPPTPSDDTQHERIAKVMARAGLCSRRDAEKWIEAGRVKVNGKVIISPALNVGVADLIEVDDQPLPEREQARLWRYHKPSGLVVSHRDEQGRTSVFDKMPEGMPRVISIGRLDINTEGMLLLTNDGELARLLELPATGWLRRYRVRAHGTIEPAALEPLKDGLTVDGIRYGPIEATMDKQQGSNVWLTISLREGKNREVKRICEHLGLVVNRLIRVSFGPFQLGDLPRGEVDEVSPKVIAEQIRGGARSRQGHAAKGEDKPVRPGSRSPAKSGGKPTAKPGGKPAGKPAGKFAGKPAGRFAGKPAGRFAGKKTEEPADGRSGKPSGRTAGKPSGKPSARPGARGADRRR